MPKCVDNISSDLPINELSVTAYLSYCASFDAILAADSAIQHPQVLLLREKTFEKNRKMNNSWTHALFRVNRVSIDSLRSTKSTETKDELSTTCNPKVMPRYLSTPDATSLHHCLQNHG